jgi:Glyoxalase-like domain
MATVPVSCIDHIAVTAPTLAVGAAWVEQVLGVAPQPGGEHPQMGTHNVLLRLGDDIYLEVIAANPGAPAPARPRWFGLDALQPDSAPRLRTWIARTSDIGATLAAAGEELGTVTPMQRGDLQWLITIPDDGKPPLGGTAPALIEWKSGPHPASRLQDHGLRLERLELLHPRPLRVLALLEAISIDAMVQVRHPMDGEGSSLVAHIATPQGMRSLSIAA